MKKLISLFITLVLVLMVGACSPTSSTDLENRVEVLEETVATQQEQIELMQEFYENVVSVRGLNGQVDYYVNEGQTYYLSASYMTMLANETEKDYLDKTKFPDYIWDNDGEYIDIDTLCNDLTMKYLGVPSTSKGGTYFTIQMNNKPTDMGADEFIVRVSMMLVELSNYDFYTIDSSQVYLEFVAGASSYMLVRTALLIDDSYNLHPAIFWNELLETKIVGVYYYTDNLETMYNDYVTNETFAGYVLPNYK